MARVLVTGATGFAGRRLVARLAARGIDEVHGLSRTPPAARAEGWTHHACDLVGDAVVPTVRAIAPDAVFHLGALAHPGDCERDEPRALRVNAGGTRRVLEALEGTPARLLLASTAVVCGDPPGGRVREHAHAAPRSAYGRSKLRAEELARASGRAVIARAFNHSGPGQEPRYVLAAFAAEIRRALREGGPVRHGNLWPRRDVLHVDDVLDAYELLLARGESGGVYNVCRGSGVEIGALLDGLLARLGPGLAAQLDPTLARPGEAAELVGDNSRLRGLGWVPRRSLEQLLDDVAGAS